jgi:sugar diacid utilization regulator
VAQSKFYLFSQGVAIGLGLPRAIIEKILGIIGFSGSQNKAKNFGKSLWVE